MCHVKFYDMTFGAALSNYQLNSVLSFLSSIYVAANAWLDVRAVRDPSPM